LHLTARSSRSSEDLITTEESMKNWPVGRNGGARVVERTVQTRARRRGDAHRSGKVDELKSQRRFTTQRS